MTDTTNIKKITRIYTQAVTAFLGFGAVRIDNAQSWVVLIATVDRQTVGSYTIVAMAQDTNLLVAQLFGNRTMAYKVIIT